MSSRDPPPAAPTPSDPSLSLLTDLYQLTMAYGYWKLGRAEKEAVFNLFYRTNPFAGGYCVAAGLQTVVEFIRAFSFDPSDLAYLETLTGNDGAPLFEPAFLEALGALSFQCSIDAVEEGTVVFPHEPLVRVQGPIMQCQLLETSLLNLTNFPTLIATKAARICQAAQGDPVLEFGLRRAQGIDGAITASRAAYIGGCSHTSNVLAGKRYGIPVKGTHAHSWIMSFDDEGEAFAAYAEVMPNNCVFLVDTYDTLDGVRQAVAIGHRLRARGHRMIGIRLDSGDLAYLSIEARRILDDGGFPDAVIVASNDLDEHIIASLKDQGAAIGVWGVGTKLASGYDQPALGGVYKLTALRDPGREWEYKVKLSEQTIKASIPGLLRVRRYSDESGFLADMIYDEALGVEGRGTIVDPMDPTRRRSLDDATEHEELLAPIFRGGELVYDLPSIHTARARAVEQLGRCHAGTKRFVNPHRYPVGLERQLHDLRTDLIMQAGARTLA